MHSDTYRNILRRVMAACACLAALLVPAWAPAQAAPAATPPDQTAPAGAVPLLRFADFYRMPVGPRGAEMTPALQQANGRRVRLVGYMVQQEDPAPGQFLLAPRPVQMSEHADGDADDLPIAWALVRLDPSQQDFAVPHQRGLVELAGLLSVGREEGADGRVSWVRLQLDADATRLPQPDELPASRHALEHHH